MNLSFHTSINSTPEQVFAWIKNPEQAQAWMSSVTQTEILHETPEIVGTTFRERIEENGKSTEMQGIITEFTSNQLISFSLRGRFNNTQVRYIVTPDQGQTLLTLEARLRFKSFAKIIMFFLGHQFKKKILAQLQSELETLKDLCEGGTRAHLKVEGNAGEEGGKNDIPSSLSRA